MRHTKGQIKPLTLIKKKKRKSKIWLRLALRRVKITKLFRRPYRFKYIKIYFDCICNFFRRELAKTPLGNDVAETLANNPIAPDHMNPLALMAAIGKSQQNGGQPQPQSSREMTVNGEMINVMMAQSQGQKLEEIRRMSGAQIHISEQGLERLITLTGSEESILLAQFLIQSNVEAIMKEKSRSLQPPPPQQDNYPNR